MLAFFKAGICGLDAVTDLALAEIMYRVANNTKLSMFEGHSYMEEGVSPISNSDGRFIESVVEQFSERKLKSYPKMSFLNF